MVSLFKILPKIGPIGIWMGYFFLKKWYLYGSTFKFRGGTSLPKPNLNTPLGLPLSQAKKGKKLLLLNLIVLPMWMVHKHTSNHSVAGIRILKRRSLFTFRWSQNNTGLKYFWRLAQEGLPDNFKINPIYSSSFNNQHFSWKLGNICNSFKKMTSTSFML